MIKRLPLSTIALALLAMHLPPMAAQSAPAAGQKPPQSASGRYWMEKGISPRSAGDLQAAAFELTAVAQ